MYKCKKCKNTNKFKEVNVVDTYIFHANNRINTYDNFVHREEVVCLDCGSVMSNNDVEEL